MSGIEKAVLLSRLNNGPKKRADGKPLSYKAELDEAVAEVVPGEIVAQDG